MTNKSKAASSNQPEKWKVVRGREAYEFGIARESTPAPFEDIAQMVNEEDAIEIVRSHNEAASRTVEQPEPEPRSGKYPIDRPCSACSAGDTKMEYHDHTPPFRKGYGPSLEPELPEREAFEKVAHEVYNYTMFTKLEDGVYVDSNLRSLWKFWNQARSRVSTGKEK